MNLAISRLAIKDAKELNEIVSRDVSLEEMGLTVICRGLPLDSKTVIDILCHDEDGQLAIVKVSTEENDDIFFEGLKVLSHVNTVKLLLKFSYKEFKINEKLTPSLVFLAPSYSDHLTNIIGQIQGLRIDLYTWEYFEFDNKKALNLEPVWLSEATKSRAGTVKKRKPKKTVEPEQEPEPEPEPEPIVEEAVIPPKDVKAEPPKADSENKSKKKKWFD